MRRMSRWIALAAVVITLGGASCSTDQPAVCDSLEAVQGSLTRLRNASVAENGLTQLKTDLSQLKVDLQQFLADAKAESATEVDAVQTAVSQFSATLATARATPDAANLSAVRSSLNVLAAGVRDLGENLSGTC